MAQIKMLLPLVALAIGGCASNSTRDSSAVELAASASRVSTFAASCKGAQKTSVCDRNGECRCTDSGMLLQTLGLDDAQWQAQ